MSNIKINEQILFLRKERGITQEQLSSTLGVSNQAVSKWESGQCCPDITLLPDIAKYFDISVDELLGYERSDNTNNIIFDLRNTLKALPHGEDHRFALKAAYHSPRTDTVKGHGGSENKCARLGHRKNT